MANQTHYRMAVKHSINSWLPPRIDNDLNDICVFSSRRGGSTWLMETICAHPGHRYCDQPFSYYSAPTLIQQWLPQRRSSAFFHLDAEEEPMVEQYFRRILEGTLNINSRWDLWKPGFWKCPERIVPKVVEAKSLITWFQQRFDIDVIYQIRHPVSQSLSVIRAGWENTSAAYLDSRWFVDHWMTSAQHTMAQRILRNDSRLEQFVLNWCLENLIPLRQCVAHPEWLTVSYEEMLSHPRQLVNLVSEHCRIENRDALEKQIHVPSRTTGITNHSHTGVNSKSQIAAWRSKVTAEKEKRCLEILQMFDLNVYEMDRDLPNESFLNFPDPILQGCNAPGDRNSEWFAQTLT